MLIKKGNEIICSKYKFWLWSDGTMKRGNICNKCLPRPSIKVTCRMPHPMPCKLFIKTKKKQQWYNSETHDFKDWSRSSRSSEASLIKQQIKFSFCKRVTYSCKANFGCVFLSPDQDGQRNRKTLYHDTTQPLAT